MSILPLGLLTPSCLILNCCCCSFCLSLILMVTIKRTVQPTAMRWLQNIHYICVYGPSAPFVSVGAIPIRFAHSDFAEIVINQATFQMTVHLQTCPQNSPPTSTKTEHLCDKLRQESVELVPGAQMYKRDNVTVSYLDGCTFLICVLHSQFFPLGLVLYTEDQYIFILDPYSFALMPVPEGDPTPIPLLLFTS